MSRSNQINTDNSYCEHKVEEEQACKIFNSEMSENVLDTIIGGYASDKLIDGIHVVHEMDDHYENSKNNRKKH